MIVTERFVLINNPKTGSTFARRVIEKLYANLQDPDKTPHDASLSGCSGPVPSLQSLMICDEWPSGIHLGAGQHGRWEDIPQEFRDRPVCSILRNPFDRLVSEYEFPWWRTNPMIRLETVHSEFPHFPRLDFSEYFRYRQLVNRVRWGALNVRPDIGPQTVGFVRFFFRNPKKILSMIDDHFVYTGHYKEHMPPITFLRTENLNRQLFELLREYGYPENRIAFILEEPPIRPGKGQRSSDEERAAYWTDDFLAVFTHHERLLFRIYEDLGMSYCAPSSSNTVTGVE